MALHKEFGLAPDNKRKKQFNTLSNYKKGKFQNLSPTPALAEGETMLKATCDFFSKHANSVPVKDIPFVNTNLKKINRDENVFIWFGHSSYFMQIDGKKFLIDPVFSGHASPVSGTVKAFKGTNHYQITDMPEIDFLLITHDHWDHLDYKTIIALKEKTKKVICGLGVAQHFEYWGWASEKLIEKNWFDNVHLGEGFKITLTPARHFSGRMLARNISLWTSYVLETPSNKIFIGGDSGYDSHFKIIGQQFGPFDWAIMECGQYNKNWPYIHSFPEETITEVLELKTKNFIPVHNSKFKLAFHPWYEPLQKITALAEQEGIAITTPKIGEKVNFSEKNKIWPKWWETAM